MSLARGAQQLTQRDIGLSRVVGLQRPGDPDCVTDAIMSGLDDGPPYNAGTSDPPATAYARRPSGSLVRSPV